MGNRIYVGNLSFKIKSNDLNEMFSEFGDIEDAIVITDKNTRKSKGFGFVTFSNEADAKKAISEMNEKEVDGRKITVNESEDREERPRRDHERSHDYPEDEYSKFYSTKVL